MHHACSMHAPCAMHTCKWRVWPCQTIISASVFNPHQCTLSTVFKLGQIDYMFHGQARLTTNVDPGGRKKIKWISLKTSWISLKRNHKLPKVSLPWAYHHSSRFDDILTTFDQDALLNHAAMMQMAINNKVSHFNCTVLLAVILRYRALNCVGVRWGYAP